MDFDFLLKDRLQKIEQINLKYDLEKNAYIAFSGGKDSTVLHHLIDMALPLNKIPRVYANTGVEYSDIVKFVEEMAKKDERIIILKPTQNIREMLERVGYPFKSKEFASVMRTYQHSGRTASVKRFTREVESTSKNYCCKKLLPCFTPQFNLKVSDKCCEELKKKPSRKWATGNSKSITITGIRAGEGGYRRFKSDCLAFDKGNTLKKFNPLFPVDEEWIDKFIHCYDIEIAKLYFPPYNLKRTGCRGCPFNFFLKDELKTIKEYLPQDYKASVSIFRNVYEKYIELDYRLGKNFEL